MKRMKFKNNNAGGVSKNSESILPTKAAVEVGSRKPGERGNATWNNSRPGESHLWMWRTTSETPPDWRERQVGTHSASEMTPPNRESGRREGLPLDVEKISQPGESHLWRWRTTSETPPASGPVGSDTSYSRHELLVARTRGRAIWLRAQAGGVRVVAVTLDQSERTVPHRAVYKGCLLYTSPSPRD